ncbi:LacI family DNA-binding transcriptional regulator [Aegicerativicinus sediminis]
MRKREKVTIYDISKKLNISAATVSRALNGNPNISEKTRDLVMKTAEEMNYKQNRLAQALKKGKTNTVGVIVPYIDRNFFSSVIRGIEEELTGHGYYVIISQSHEDAKNEVNQLNALLNTQIDGIFMSVSKNTRNGDHIRKAIEEKTPVIFFDRKLDIPGVSSVVIDDFKGGYISTDHLLKKGCKHIACFIGNMELEIYQNRFKGYKAALEHHGIPYIEELVVQTNSKIESGIEAVNKLWQGSVIPDAIFATSDYAALGAIQQLKAIGIRIPEDVCVVGFSNEPFTKYLDSPLSSVDQTPHLMGKIAAQVFLEQVNGSKELTIEKKVVLSPELIARESSNR